jgi:ABC-type nitrate/sulfonate/bicarbonate transport system substrate-binding protein
MGGMGSISHQRPTPVQRTRIVRRQQRLASYKRYYLSSAAFADRRGDVLNAIFGKLDETGKWVKANPKDAAALLGGLWGIDAATVEEANSHRSYKVGVVAAPAFPNSSASPTRSSRRDCSR